MKITLSVSCRTANSKLDIRDLTYENVHEFIDRISIHEADSETKTRKVEIQYSFVGQIENDENNDKMIQKIKRGGLCEAT